MTKRKQAYYIKSQSNTKCGDSTMKAGRRGSFYSSGSWSLLEQKLSFSAPVIFYLILACLLASTNQQYLNDDGTPGTTMMTKTTRATMTTTMLNNNGNQNSNFVQRPFSSPPTVRPPPYFNSLKSCSVVVNERENWEGNLCGDLNSQDGIPINPFGQMDFPDNLNYPFEAIKNKTLEFFRKALPVLKTYKSLPKVARYGHGDAQPQRYRAKRSVDEEQEAGGEEEEEVAAVDAKVEGRTAKKLNIFGSRVKRTHMHSHSPKPHNYNNGNSNICENAIFCKLLNTMYDKLPQGFQRLVSQETHKRLSHQLLQQLKSSVSSVTNANMNNNNNNNNNPVQSNVNMNGKAHSLGELLASETNNHIAIDVPQTPCPSSAEYLTPVFARNHEGAWRYVVQIPREGYFTQTVEVTKCIQSNCMFMEGTCKTSPRWQSLLVAEMFYPDAAFPLVNSNNNFRDLGRQKRNVGRRRRIQIQNQSTNPNPSLTTSQRLKKDEDIKSRVISGGSNKSTNQKDVDSGDSVDPSFFLSSEDWSARRRRMRRRRNGTISNGVKTMRTFDGKFSSTIGGKMEEVEEEEASSKDFDLDTSASTNMESKINNTVTTHHCDGYDEIGCYQFRLFYDWFLIPGECKCWRKSFASMF